MRSFHYAILALLILASCTRKHDDPGAFPPPLIEARGRVTVIDSANRPDTATLAPPATMRLPTLVAVDNNGAQGSATGKPLIRTHTTNDGLPVDAFWCGTMDRNGMLWFGSNGGGLVRYDGRSFTSFALSSGLNDVVVLALTPDRKGNLWIGTSMGGLCMYDGRSFTKWSDAEGFPNKGVTSILEDREGMLWLGTRGKGLGRFDGKTFSNFTKKDGLMSDQIRDVVEDKDGRLWIGTGSGLSRFYRERFINYTKDTGLPMGSVWSLHFASDGELWLGDSDGNVVRAIMHGDGPPTFIRCIDASEGLGRINNIMQNQEGDIWLATENAGAVKIGTASSHSAVPPLTRFGIAEGLTNENVEDIVADRSGDLWFVTSGGGLCQFRGNAFVNYLGTHAYGMAEDRNGALWLATTDGAKYLDLDGRSLKTPPHPFRDNNVFYAVSRDRHDRILWGDDPFGAHDCAFSVIDGDRYTVYPSVHGDLFTYIFWVMEDSRGSIWKAGNGGACRYDGLNDVGTPVRRVKYTAEQGLPNNIVLGMLEDHHGNMWFGTDGGGIARFDRHSFTAWTSDDGLPNGVVWSIVEDAAGHIWCSTFKGISRFDGRSFLSFNTTDGLPDNNVTQLFLTRAANDSTGRGTRNAELLIGTLNGLAILTSWVDASGDTIPFAGAPVALSNEDLRGYKPVFEVYNPARGYPIKDAEDGQQALFEDSHGIIWAGTGSSRTGLVRFDRKALTRHDPRPPTVVLEGIAIRNERLCWYDLLENTADSATLAHQESIALGKVLSPKERDQYRTDHGGIRFSGLAPFFPIPEGLVLDHANNRIDFDFVGVETSSPGQVEYQYMLEGYDAQWSIPTRMGTASYGNIWEGDYAFKVKAKSPFGVWSEPVEYHFTVLPPVHRTWWAYLLYVLFLGGSTWSLIRLRIAGLRRQQRKLVRLVAKRTEELRHKKEEADQQRGRAELSEKAKEQFLANMSHEIRTPMNAIMGMTGILQRNAHAPEQDRYLNAIAQSSENLLVILNDILDLSKIDAGRIDFEEVPFDPRKVMDNVKEIMQFKAEEKKLSMMVEVATEVPAMLMGDPTRLHQVLLNLAGNAIKFTEHGSVTIRVRCSVDPVVQPAQVELIVAVIDTGIGIPEDKLERIFEEFTQAYSDTTRKYGGTGLGLTISKRLAELQGGTLSVTSEKDQGSTFTVTIPYVIASSTGSEIPYGREISRSDQIRDLRILLAEDNEFNVMVAQDELADAIPGVRVDVAANGRIAVEMAQANDYDVILMDVQMPEMNGYDAARAIRALGGDKSRIPIIAMTANVMLAELELCREAGMNWHVPKPFKREELLAGIDQAMR